MAGKHSTWQKLTVKLWILLAVLAACDQGSRAGGSTDGAQVFQSVCAQCHGPTGKPTEAMIARLNVRDLTNPEFRGKLTPALVEAQVRNGSKNKLMPSFSGALSDDQIKAVAAYVASPGFVTH
jgi:mono/diheme cytochrome c family protein